VRSNEPISDYTNMTVGRVPQERIAARWGETGGGASRPEVVRICDYLDGFQRSSLSLLGLSYENIFSIGGLIPFDDQIADRDIDVCQLSSAEPQDCRESKQIEHSQVCHYGRISD